MQVEFLNRLVDIPRRSKRALLLTADAVMVPACLIGALALKYDALSAALSQPFWIYGLAALSGVTFFYLFGLYRAVTRYFGFRTLGGVLGGACTTSGLVWLTGNSFPPYQITVSVAIIFALNVLVWVSATRLMARWALTLRLTTRLPVVIFGAGEAGLRLAMMLAAGGRMRLVAYADDKKSLQGTTVSGVRVVSPRDLPELIRTREINVVLLAIPAASQRRRSEIIREMADLNVKVQTVPDLNDIISGRASLADLRDISVEDLLGRDAVAADPRLLGANIRGKSVMVSGAGGSIGSELCRQILGQEPSRLILFELSEIALYDIQRELIALAAGRALKTEIVGLLGNAHHQDRLREVMRAFSVQTVYHAAAYKHVPIVEENVVEGIYNNVFATWHAAEAAIEAGVEAFVLISTDKAVHPTSVMGATKRFAEIVLQGVQSRQSKTRLCMVRFGNVLDSSGSVVPLFKEQIRSGGPVTVTHPEVRRYFMTIPEAASLVLQAGAMSKGGEVFLLDMGQPVVIDDLARRMIALSGLTVRDERHPAGDIEIRYTGLRPAEKLYEELLIGEGATGTDHPMIMQATERGPAWEEVQLLLTEMRRALEQFDCDRARLLLTRAVREYMPPDRVHDLVWLRKQVPPVESRTAAAAAARHLRAVPPPGQSS